MASITTLTDDFGDNSLSASWTRANVGSATIAEQNARWECALLTSAGFHYGITRSTTQTYDLTGVRTYIQFVQAPTTPTSVQTWVIEFLDDANNSVYWYYDASTNDIEGSQKVAGVETIWFSATYVPDTHKWFALRESGGTTYWETSVDGVNWTVRYSRANPITLSSGYVDFAAGTFESVGSPGTAIWDNFNTLGPAVTLLTGAFPEVRPRIHVNLYEPVTSALAGQPLAHMDIDVDITALTWTKSLPGGANSLSIGLETPAYRGGWGPSLAFFPEAVRTKAFADVLVKAGPATVFEGRWMEDILGPEGVQGGVVDGYGVSATTDDFYESADTTLTTTGDALKTIIADAAPALSRGNSAEWSDPGVAHALIEFDGMTVGEALDQLMREGGGQNVVYDWWTINRRVVLLPRVAPDTPHYRVGYDPETMDIRRHYREVFGSLVITYTIDGGETELAESENAEFVNVYGIRRRRLVSADELTTTGATQLQATMLAKGIEPAYSVSLELGPGQWLTSAAGVPVPHWLVDVGQWIKIANYDPWIIVNLSYNARADQLSLELAEQSRVSFDAYLAATCEEVTKLAVGINPVVGGKRRRPRRQTDIGAAATASFANVNTHLDSLRTKLQDAGMMEG